MKRKRAIAKGRRKLPDYSHFIPRRSKAGGHVTPELVAKLLGDQIGEDDVPATGETRDAPLGPLDPRLRRDDHRR